jgi:transcriptional regulator
MMLIHSWDSAVDEEEWKCWLADGHDFGELAVNDPDDLAPAVVPTHFATDGRHLLIHLARTNPARSAIEARPNVLMTVVDDYAFIPSAWREDADGPDENGVPTSYYAAVQLACRAEVVDDLDGIADLLVRQLTHFQPLGDHPVVAVDRPPNGPMLSEIRGLRLHIDSVAAKLKYDDQNPLAPREAVAHRLDQRGSPRDPGAAAQQRRRLRRVGDCRNWRAGQIGGSPCGGSLTMNRSFPSSIVRTS